MREEKIKVGLVLSRELYEEIKEAAEKERRTYSEVVSYALREYLERSRSLVTAEG